jgi:hypothetical protein
MLRLALGRCAGFGHPQLTCVHLLCVRCALLPCVVLCYCSVMERGWSLQQPIALQDAQEALQPEG